MLKSLLRLIHRWTALADACEAYYRAAERCAVAGSRSNAASEQCAKAATRANEIECEIREMLLLDRRRQILRDAEFRSEAELAEVTAELDELRKHAVAEKAER